MAKRALNFLEPKYIHTRKLQEVLQFFSRKGWAVAGWKDFLRSYFTIQHNSIVHKHPLPKKRIKIKQTPWHPQETSSLPRGRRRPLFSPVGSVALRTSLQMSATREIRAAKGTHSTFCRVHSQLVFYIGNQILYRNLHLTLSRVVEEFFIFLSF